MSGFFSPVPLRTSGSTDFFCENLRASVCSVYSSAVFSRTSGSTDFFCENLRASETLHPGLISAFILKFFLFYCGQPVFQICFFFLQKAGNIFLSAGCFFLSHISQRPQSYGYRPVSFFPDATALPGLKPFFPGPDLS